MSGIQFETHIPEVAAQPFRIHYVYRLSVQEARNQTINWHTNVEIIYCLNGSGEVLCGTKRIQITKGDMVIINSELLHNLIPKTFLEYWCLIIDDSFCHQNGIMPEKIYFDDFIRSKTAEAVFNEVIKAYNSEEPLKMTRIRHATLGLILYLCENHAQDVNYLKPSDENLDRVKEIMLYIKKHYTEKLTLDGIAEKMNISKYYLAHEFKRFTDQTVFEYINILRCTKAKSLIKSGMSVSAAALSTGFENMSYFSRTYKRYISILPSEDKE